MSETPSIRSSIVPSIDHIPPKPYHAQAPAIMRQLLLVPLPVLALLLVAAVIRSDDVVERVTTASIGPEPRTWHVPCSDHYAEAGAFVEGCYPTDCKRVLHDGFLTRAEVDWLISIAERAMAAQPKTGGPVIADINSGAWLSVGC